MLKKDKYIAGLIIALVGLWLIVNSLSYKIRFMTPAVSMDEVTTNTIHNNMVVEGPITWSVGPYYIRRKWLGRNNYDRMYLVRLSDGNYASLKADSNEDPYIYRLSKISEDAFIGQPQDVVADPVNIHGIVRKSPAKYQDDLSMLIAKLNRNKAGNKIDEQKCVKYYIDYETEGSASRKMSIGLLFFIIGIGYIFIFWNRK